MAKRHRPTRIAAAATLAATAATLPRPELDTEFANRLRDPFETHYMGVLRTNDPLLLERSNGGGEYSLCRREHAGRPRRPLLGAGAGHPRGRADAR